MLEGNAKTKVAPFALRATSEGASGRISASRFDE